MAVLRHSYERVRETEAAARRSGAQHRRGRFAMLSALPLLIVGLALIGQGGWVHAKAFLAQHLLDRAFTQTIATREPAKPWPWADTWPVARIEAPRLGESAIVLKGVSGEALAFGPGHLDGTPQAGEAGTAVYAAHRDTHFAFLANVKEGDEIRVTRDDGQIFSYHVTGMTVVRWDQSGIDAYASGHSLMLATCWPFGAMQPGPLRFLVHAQLNQLRTMR